MSKCRKCGDEYWLPVRCCNRYMCACGGHPVDIEPCDWCNKDEEHMPEGYAKECAEYIGFEPPESSKESK